MAISRDYRVAGHSFRIQADQSILDLLANYAPFEIQDAGEEKLFDLTIHMDGDVNAGALGMKHVFTDSSDEDMPRIEIYKNDKGAWLIGVSMYRDSDIVCHIFASQDFRHSDLYIATGDVRFAIDNATMLLYAFTTASLYTLEMHASVIKREGRGYLFLGKSGTGKSTHSRQWMEAFEDAELLNDDNPIVRLLKVNGQWQVRVYGSPWSGKTPCYKNDDVPVQAIVKLSQAPQNQLRVLRLPEAYAYMLSSSSGLKILPEMMDALYDTISTLVQNLQVYGLECLPNTDAARVCYSGTNQ